MSQPANYTPVHQTRILVDRRAALGDVVMITPVLRELRRRHPASFIQVVTEEAEVLANNPHVDKVAQPAEMSQQDPWDIYINLNDAYETNVTSHYVDSMMHRAFGIEDGEQWDRTLIKIPTQEEREAVDELIEENGIQDFIVIHMRRWAWENKNVDIETWADYVTLLGVSYPNLKIITVGAKYDGKLPAHDEGRWIDLNSQLSLGEIAYLISRARMFVGTDSGPYHLACTTETPILLLSSHLAPSQIMPWRGDNEFGKGVETVFSRVPCLGCYARQTPPVRELTCENTEQWACSKAFDVEDMLKASIRMLEKEKG
jgi:ADP-heptose:LPS heptosyltransferase